MDGRLRQCLEATAYRFVPTSFKAQEECVEVRTDVSFHLVNMWQRSNNNLAIYESAAMDWNRVLWLYVPIDQGDMVSEIWKRSGRLNRQLALLFKTIRGRLYQLGPQQRASWGPCTWTLLDHPSPEPVHISFDHSEVGIHKLAFETPAPRHNSTDPALPLPASTFPESTSLQDYFYSSALLDDVVNVALSVHPSVKKITGLLFHRSNGDQACVGEIRLDCLQPPMQVSRLSELWLGFVSTSHGVYVEIARLSRPHRMPSAQWFRVPMRGLLEWWFSADQCKVYHSGRASPATRL